MLAYSLREVLLKASSIWEIQVLYFTKERKQVSHGFLAKLLSTQSRVELSLTVLGSYHGEFQQALASWAFLLTNLLPSATLRGFLLVNSLLMCIFLARFYLLEAHRTCRTERSFDGKVLAAIGCAHNSFSYRRCVPSAHALVVSELWGRSYLDINFFLQYLQLDDY